jgi:hypothetical protein
MNMSSRILILCMGLLSAQAFTPLPVLPMSGSRSKSAVTCLQMSSAAPKNNLDRRGALYLASALAAGLALPTSSFADDLPIAVIGPADGNIGGECVAALVRSAFHTNIDPLCNRALFPTLSKTGWLHPYQGMLLAPYIGRCGRRSQGPFPSFVFWIAIIYDRCFFVFLGKPKCQSEGRVPQTYIIFHRGCSWAPEPGHRGCDQAIHSASSCARVRYLQFIIPMQVSSVNAIFPTVFRKSLDRMCYLGWNIH